MYKHNSLEAQKLYLEYLLNDHELFVRCNSILNENFFHDSYKPVVRYMKDYVEKYSVMPDPIQLNTATGIFLEERNTEPHREWFLDEFELFCKHKSVGNAFIEAVDFHEKGDFGAVYEIFKNSIEIGIPKEFGTSYFRNPKDRIQAMLEQQEKISTGWDRIDEVLYGGFEHGGLNIFLGNSGAGKSLFLQNLALNWAERGYNILYVTLELSEAMCSLRMDAMLTGYSTRDIFKNIDDAALKISIKGKKSGSIQIVQLKAGSTTAQLKSFVKEYQIQNKVKLHGVLVDYLDLMHPSTRVKFSGDNLFVKDKYISEELRNFATENGFLFGTASQLNRGSVDETVFDHSHIAGGLSKIQTADNVMAIRSSRTWREAGKIQIQFLKTRTSNGEGREVFLGYDKDNMRITDLEDEEQTPESLGKQAYDAIIKRGPSPVPELSNDERRQKLQKLIGMND